ncbi:hypothetical protein [Pimelobacter sp. 30-1]|uniref:hypothetical protein n=1 Tax=Pimelobacter sp. 30-1 TaxID=2004991 RepID=UPI001C03F089|nr:hypothetical protein [Pimelobacter sp. 30-1]MBU2693525.1 hypothetical protein [Pimelobacter sp. 30-1]
MRRRPVPLLGLVLVAALALGGCGDGEDDARSAEPAGVLSVDQIEDILLPVGAKLGDATVHRKPGTGIVDDRLSAPESCQPLASLIKVDPHPVHADRVGASPPWISPYAEIQVLTYAGQDAEKVFAAVDQTIDACGNGFNLELLGQTDLAREVVRDAAPALGDEAVAYHLLTHESEEEEPLDEHEYRVLVRDGQHLLSWRTVGLDDDGAVEARDLLTAFVDAQWARYAERR